MTTRTFDDGAGRGRATFSDCGTYRYDLRRTWDWTLPTVAFVMLNPSTATEEIVDPTLNRGLSFAKKWGFGCLIFRNAFALRSTDPKGLKGDVDPIGPDNDVWLSDLKHDAQLIIAAWGVHATLYGRDRTVKRLLADCPDVRVLGLTKDGHPKHPLYLPSATEPQPWAVLV